jgi:hypothetical protein
MRDWALELRAHLAGLTSVPRVRRRSSRKSHSISTIATKSCGQKARATATHAASPSRSSMPPAVSPGACSRWRSPARRHRSCRDSLTVACFAASDRTCATPSARSADSRRFRHDRGDARGGHRRQRHHLHRRQRGGAPHDAERRSRAWRASHHPGQPPVARTLCRRSVDRGKDDPRRWCLVVGVLASAVPERRALRLDPVTALQTD